MPCYGNKITTLIVNPLVVSGKIFKRLCEELQKLPNIVAYKVIDIKIAFA